MGTRARRSVNGYFMARRFTKEGKAELFHIFYMRALEVDQSMIERRNCDTTELEHVEKRLHSNWYKKHAKEQIQQLESGVADYGGRMAEEIWAAEIENAL